MAPKVEERVDSLERIMKELANAQLRTEKNISELSKEMKDFKKEMRDFKEEMRNEAKRMNKKWGELANKMGTVVEDIVAPNIPRVAKEYFGCDDLDDFMIRRRVKNKKDRTKIREFDVIAICKDKLIINETKSTVRITYVDDFIKVLSEIYDYFPEYRGLKVILIFSSFSIPEDIVNYLTKNKIYAMVVKDDTMEIINPEL